MPPKAKSTAPLSDADVPVASSICRKTRNTTKMGESSDVKAPPGTIGRKTRNEKKASSKAEDSDTGEISKATSSTPYEENDSRTSRETRSGRGKTPARDLAHVKEAKEIHKMKSNSLEFSASETARLEEPRETPETDSTFPVTPGAPDLKRKPRISPNQMLPVEPGSSTPEAVNFAVFIGSSNNLMSRDIELSKKVGNYAIFPDCPIDASCWDPNGIPCTTTSDCQPIPASHECKIFISCSCDFLQENSIEAKSTFG